MKLFRPKWLSKALAVEVLLRARAGRLQHPCNHEVRFGVAEDAFAKGLGLITDFLHRLHAEASSEASHKTNCNGGTSKATQR